MSNRFQDAARQFRIAHEHHPEDGHLAVGLAESLWLVLQQEGPGAEACVDRTDEISGLIRQAIRRGTPEEGLRSWIDDIDTYCNGQGPR